MQRLEAVRQSCDPQAQCLTWRMDLDDISAVEETLTGFIRDAGIDIAHFVHCAGVMKMLPLKMMTAEVLQKHFNTNVFAAACITKTLAGKKSNKSALKSAVYISSNISNMGARALSAYGASKGALDALMRCLAMELAPKVRINSVLPGAVMTEMTGAIFENETVAERMAATYPLGFGHPDDIYEMVDFLLSDKAKWVTGQQFTVDGGRTVNVSG